MTIEEKWALLITQDAENLHVKTEMHRGGRHGIPVVLEPETIEVHFVTCKSCDLGQGGALVLSFVKGVNVVPTCWVDK